MLCVKTIHLDGSYTNYCVYEIVVANSQYHYNFLYHIFEKTEKIA